MKAVFAPALFIAHALSVEAVVLFKVFTKILFLMSNAEAVELIYRAADAVPELFPANEPDKFTVLL